MKLISKLTLWYIAITTIVLLIGGFILFKVILYEVDREAQRKLYIWVSLTAEQIEQGAPVDSVEHINNIKITELDFEAPEQPFVFKDTMGIFPPKEYGEDRKISLSKSYKIGDRHYHISTYSFVAEPDEIIFGLSKSLLVILGILLLILGVLSLIISRKVLAPFNSALVAIKNFDLKQKEPMRLPEARTSEFRELNNFLEKMSEKVLKDYRILKEFSENASHEIQTPISVIRGKLEMLMATSINEEQASYMSAIQNAVQKLSNVNQSLLLLTRLENREYSPDQEVNISEKLNNALVAFHELIQMRGLDYESNIEPEVVIRAHPTLVEIMLSNLISNAIKHNVKDGRIGVELNSDQLRIENTGEDPMVPTGELFKRFKKNNQSSESTGLGLSIVSQICEVNNFTIDYSFGNSMHSIVVKFQ